MRRAELVLPEELIINQVANPDGLDCCWLFPLAQPGRFVLPWLVFAESAMRRKMPQDFRMRAVPVVAEGYEFRVMRDAGGRVQTRDLAQIPEYTKAFPLTENFYHPNEVAADLFAQLVVHDSLSRDEIKGGRPHPEKEFAPVRSWFRANLSK